MKPKQGDLVISKSTLKDDPNFINSILLFVEANAEGGVAFMLNKPLNMLVSQLVDGFNCQNMVFFGGPVQTDSIHYIHKFGGVQDCREILEGVYWGGDFEEIKLLAKHNKIDGSNAKFFVGYAGWTAFSLSNELSKSFRVIGKARTNELFLENKDTIETWERLYLTQMESKLQSQKGDGRLLKIKQECRHLISKNKITDAIQLIIDSEGFDSQVILNEVILISGKYHEIETKKRIGIINSAEEDIMLNQVRNSLLKVIENSNY